MTNSITIFEEKEKMSNVIGILFAVVAGAVIIL